MARFRQRVLYLRRDNWRWTNHIIYFIGWAIERNRYDKQKNARQRFLSIFINDLRDTSNKDSLKIAKWQTLAYIFKDKLFKLIHSTYNGLLPKQLCTSIINKRVSWYAFRGTDNTIVPRFTSCHLQQSISFRGAVLWMQSHQKTLILFWASRTISSRLSKIKDFTEFTFRVESASTVDLSNQDFEHF